MAELHNPVSEVMSRDAVSVDEKLTLRSLASVLAELDIGVVLVRGPDGAMSVVSERDVVHALAEGADPEAVWAADVVSTDIVFAEPEETILTVAEKMAAKGIRHVAVVDNGAIVGIVSERDLLSIITSHARSKT